MKNISKIRKNIDSNYMEIYADYFGCSLLTLFTQDNLEFETIEDEVEAFLYLLKKFIDSGLILVVSPLSGEKEKIIQYVRKELHPQIRLYQMEVDENAFRLRPVII